LAGNGGRLARGSAARVAGACLDGRFGVFMAYLLVQQATTSYGG
jgi:hypothetical protein